MGVAYSRMLVQLEGLTVLSLSKLLLGGNLQGQRSEVTNVHGLRDERIEYVHDNCYNNYTT